MRLNDAVKKRVRRAAHAYNEKHRQPGQHRGSLTRATLDVLRALLWGFPKQWSPVFSELGDDSRCQMPQGGVGARFVQNRTPSGNVSLISGMRNVSLRKKSPKTAESGDFPSERRFKMHPKGSGTSNRPLACDFGQTVRRPHLQRPGRKCPLFDRGARKPPVRFRPISGNSTMSQTARHSNETTPRALSKPLG